MHCSFTDAKMNDKKNLISTRNGHQQT